MQKPNKGSWRWFFDLSREARESGEAAMSLIGLIITFAGFCFWLGGFGEINAIEEKLGFGVGLFGLLITIGSLLNCAKKRCQDLEDRLFIYEQPKFKLSCNEDISACGVPNDDFSFFYLRMVIEADCINGVEECRGKLTRIERIEQGTEPRVMFDHESPTLPFAPSGSEDSEKKTIRQHEQCYLDVLAIRTGSEGDSEIPNNTISIATKNKLIQPNDYWGLPVFAACGEYVLTVQILGKNVSTVTALLQFDWSGSWQQARLTLIKIL